MERTSQAAEVVGSSRPCLSLVVPGLGQLYNGEAAKALLCFAGYFGPLGLSQVLGGMLWGAIRQGTDLAPWSSPFWTLYALRGVAIAIGLAVWVHAVTDAWRRAARGGRVERGGLRAAL